MKHAAALEVAAQADSATATKEPAPNAVEKPAQVEPEKAESQQLGLQQTAAQQPEADAHAGTGPSTEEPGTGAEAAREAEAAQPEERQQPAAETSGRPEPVAAQGGDGEAKAEQPTQPRPEESGSAGAAAESRPKPARWTAEEDQRLRKSGLGSAGVVRQPTPFRGVVVERDGCCAQSSS